MQNTYTETDARKDLSIITAGGDYTSDRFFNQLKVVWATAHLKASGNNCPSFEQVRAEKTAIDRQRGDLH